MMMIIFMILKMTILMVFALMAIMIIMEYLEISIKHRCNGDAKCSILTYISPWTGMLFEC